jgi:exonuclease III
MHKFDLFAFSETWLNANVDSNLILIPGYSTPLRKYRHTSRGDGVALYVADYLWCSRRSDLECDSIEILWVELVAKNLKFLCGVCYRPPNHSPHDVCEFFHHFQSMLDQIATENVFAVVILGDFNAHYNFFDTTTPNSDMGVKLFNFLECNNISQLIDEPTRITLSGEKIT